MNAVVDQLGHLLAELRRRHVFRVAAVYGAAAFGLLQVLSVVFPALLVPDWVMTVTVTLVLAGFPVAVALGWVFDLTPAGVKRTMPVEETLPASARPEDTLVIGQSVVAARMERLDALLAREGVLPLARAVDIVAQVAAGLEREHGRGRCHGRICPEAIVVAPDRQGADVVRLLDVELPGPGGGASGKAAHAEHAAPEEIAGEAIDSRTDVYALGLLLFRMLAGGDPHEAASPELLAFARVTRPPRRLQDVFPVRRYPESVQRVLDRALALRPADRQRDAAEFRRELVQAVDGERGYTRVFARLQRGVESMRAPTPSTAVIPAHPTGQAHRARRPSLTRLALMGAITVVAAALALRVSALLVAKPATTTAPGGGTLNALSTASLARAPQPGTAGDGAGEGPHADPQRILAPPKHATAVPERRSPGALPALNPGLVPEDAALILARLSERAGAAAPSASDLAGIRDTAAALWNRPGLPGHTRAFAAFLVGSSQAALKRPDACVDWVERAVALDPDRAFHEMLAVCRGKMH